MSLHTRTYTVSKSVVATAGFTIVEMMVSLALFTIVMTIATGSFLSLIGGSSQLRGEQTVMTSLNFALDSMTRDIRTGTRYYCGSPSDIEDINNGGGGNDLTSTKDCTTGSDRFSFVESGNSLSGTINGTDGARITYYAKDNGGGTKTLMRLVGYDQNAAEPVLSSGLDVTYIKFFVSGSNSLASGGLKQPTVTIVIDAKDPDDSTGKVYTLETTVTQRELDL